MGDSDSSGDERPLGERKQKLMLKAGIGLSKSHSNSPSNYTTTESQAHAQTTSTGVEDLNLQTGESARSLGQEASCPDLTAQEDKDGSAANPNQRPRRLSAASKLQTRPTASSTSGAASSVGRTAALRDAGASQAPRGRRAGRGGSRGAGTAGRRGRGRRGR